MKKIKEYIVFLALTGLFVFNNKAEAAEEQKAAAVVPAKVAPAPVENVTTTYLRLLAAPGMHQALSRDEQERRAQLSPRSRHQEEVRVNIPQIRAAYYAAFGEHADW